MSAITATEGNARRGLAASLAFLAAALVGLLGAPAAGAAIPSVFDGAVGCSVEDDGVRFCGGEDTTVASFDGALIDVNVGFPAAPASGSDGTYPLVIVSHGWGGSQASLGSMRRWLDRGYATLSISDRGFGSSCGGLDPKRLTAACAGGHIRLMDTRYEVRDVQELAGRLADEGFVDPEAIGAIGGSYGGGKSMALAALNDRTMLPGGELVPWRSPEGTPMRIAAAAPEIPWTDLAAALLPNGYTLDYAADSPYDAGPIGVMKLSFVTGLYATGLAAGNYALPLTDSDADLTTWFVLVTAGEPYELNPIAGPLVDEVTTYHSSYYIDDSVPPAPLLISNGWTDDLFPADEAIRFYNRTRARHPEAEVSLVFLDYGHQRGQGKPADVAILRQRQETFFDHHLKGDGPVAHPRVEAITQTCGGPSEGPFGAASWPELAPGEVRHQAAAPQTIIPLGGDPTTGLAFDPIAGGGACARTAGADQAGVASYRLPPAPAGGYTLAGSPTVISELLSAGPTSAIAARLLDVDPSGEQTLVARGLYRPRAASEPTRHVFQLHPNAYRFEEGHVAKLELLPGDLLYSRPANLQLPIVVSDLELRLPVLEEPGAGGALEPAPKLLPDGYELAPGYPEGAVGD